MFPYSNRSIVDFLDNRVSESISFVQVVQHEVPKLVPELVKNLVSKKSAGHDGLSHSCFKEIISEIIKTLISTCL